MPALILAIVFSVIIAALAAMLGWANYQSRRIHSPKARRARKAASQRVDRTAGLQVSRY